MISHKIFPQGFPTRISRKIFPLDFPTRISRKIFPGRISCKNFLQSFSHNHFPQSFPTRISRKIFQQEFPAIIFLQSFPSGADSPEVQQSEPVDYSGFQPSAVMPSLKPAPQEQLRAGKMSEMAKNVPLTVGNIPSKFQPSVINIKKVTVHYTLIMLGTLIFKIWLQDFFT